MSDKTSKSQIAAFVGVAKETNSTRILELGTVDTLFLSEIISSADWASKIELHCTGSTSEEFDQDLISAAEETSTKFELFKHVGSATEINDAIMELAASSPFDAIFISNSPSKEALLTSLLVCQESLNLGGIVGLSSGVVADPSLADAISSFRDMLGDAYSESADHVFVRV
jgi:predicted O-methyltransferase YrrM